MTNADKNNF